MKSVFLSITFALSILVFNLAWAKSGRETSNMKKTRSPSQATLTLADVKTRVVKQGCERSSIKVHAMELSQARERADDLFVTCPSLCSAKGCTYFVFVAQDANRFSAAGIVDGECFTKATSEKGYFDLSCRSQSGEQSSRNIWRFDGVEYR